MGGDGFFPPSPSTEEESLLGDDLLEESINVSSEDRSRLNLGEFPDVVPHVSMISQAVEKQKTKVFSEVMRSYEELKSRIQEEAKSKILSYSPGLWGEKAYGMDLKKHDVPNTTSLLLIGPKGVGKSSLVNKISRALEDNIFLSERAQVNSSNGDGTYFLHEYMIPRGSSSFCLYDTRSLSCDQSENQEMLNRWMTKGVRHGELVQRKSDSMGLRDRLKCKARKGCSLTQVRAINFVIFVVNGLSVLKSMDGADEKTKEYSQMMATNFNNPLLSFKDDKPVVVVTHGDLLSLTDRVRVRIYLGELLGVPPTRQIFDIPENDDQATALAIADMLLYCLERADRNLPVKGLFQNKVSWLQCFLLWMGVAMMVFCLLIQHSLNNQHCLNGRQVKVDWRKIRHNDQRVKVDWHKIRHLWSD